MTAHLAWRKAEGANAAKNIDMPGATHGELELERTPMCDRCGNAEKPLELYEAAVMLCEVLGPLVTTPIAKATSSAWGPPSGSGT